MKPKIFVLGGGVAGLSAALHLLKRGEYDVEVFEKTDRLGGLASSYRMGPAIFDFGPHAFHSQQPHIIQFFEDLMRDQYYEIDKNVAIKFMDRLYPYPLNPVKALQNMPLVTSFQCAVSYFWNLLTNHRSLQNLQTAEDFFVRNFGWKLYRIFFEGYTKKVWGIHPRELSAEFIKNRLPAASLFRIALTALTGKDIKVHKPHEVPLKLRIFYPKEGSIQFPNKMGEEIRRLGGRISVNSAVTSIEMRQGRVEALSLDTGGQTRRETCDYIVSTIPLPELVNTLQPSLSQDVLSSARQLGFRPILIACLWINKPKVFDFQTLYYTNRIFNRLAQMNSYSPLTAPEGTCGITAELTCSVDDELWRLPEQELVKRIVADMVTEKLIQSEEVRETMVLRHAHGYPIYKTGFESHLYKVRSAIQAIPNLFVSGRQGMFNYAQMHYGVSSGMAIAEAIAKKAKKSPLSADNNEDLLFT